MDDSPSPLRLNATVRRAAEVTDRPTMRSIHDQLTTRKFEWAIAHPPPDCGVGKPLTKLVVTLTGANYTAVRSPADAAIVKFKITV